MQTDRERPEDVVARALEPALRGGIAQNRAKKVVEALGEAGWLAGNSRAESDSLTAFALNEAVEKSLVVKELAAALKAALPLIPEDAARVAEQARDVLARAEGAAS